MNELTAAIRAKLDHDDLVDQVVRIMEKASKRQNANCPNCRKVVDIHGFPDLRQQLAAAQWLGENGWGKPPTTKETAAPARKLDVASLTDAELAALYAGEPDERG